MTVTVQHCAFIAGATGYVGSALVEELAHHGVRTHAHVRPDSPGLAQWRTRFGKVGATTDVTPWDEDRLAATLAEVRPTMVFALLGTTRRRIRASGGHDSYETVDYGLTAMLLRAVQRAAPGARFIYLSAAGTGPSARGAYLRVRWRMETELRGSGVPWTIVRPALITGSDRDEARPLERVAGPLIDGALGIAALLGARRFRDRYASIDAAALARALAHHAMKADSAGRVLGADALR